MFMVDVHLFLFLTDVVAALVDSCEFRRNKRSLAKLSHVRAMVFKVSVETIWVVYAQR